MIRKIALIVLMAITLASCTKDSDTPINNGGDVESEEIDYTATSEIKTITIPNYYEDTKEFIIYESFNRKYSLSYGYGYIRLYPYYRNNGGWSSRNPNLAGIVNFGKCESISDITQKTTVLMGNYYAGNDVYYHRTEFQPYNGYGACFMAEDNEIKYIRIFAQGYTLNSEGSIETITIQYQLY